MNLVLTAEQRVQNLELPKKYKKDKNLGDKFMVTARRSSEIISSAYEPINGGVALLERPSESAQANVQPAVKTDFSQEEARRKSNLEKLLNYDRYTEQVAETENATEEVVDMVSSLSEDDIRPTSTTMQFGEDIDQITKDMSRADARAEEGSYQLNKKGKIVITLYALVVTVILALIVLNTGVLAKLSNSLENSERTLSQKQAEFSQLQTEIESMTSNEYVIDYAQNELGMVWGK